MVYEAEKRIIENMWDNRSEITSSTVTAEQLTSVLTVLGALDKGVVRLASVVDGCWITHQWLKKAIVLSFQVQPMTYSESGIFHYFDRQPLKFSRYNADDFAKGLCRVAPGSIVRYGSYIAPKVVLMPSYINIGCYVDEGTMIDIGAVLGGGAQVGKNCHISAGVVIGGVLEPVGDNPVIIEDHVMIGANSSVVGSVRVAHGSVIAANVSLSASTRIFNRSTGEISYGVIPAYSVVVPGCLPDPSGCSISCAVIVKTVDERTRSHIVLDQFLRSTL